MIDDLVAVAIEKLEATKRKNKSTFIDAEINKVEKMVYAAASAARNSQPIDLDVNHGIAYSEFLYDLIAYQFSREAVETMKIQAKWLSKYTGNYRTWEIEEICAVEGQEKLLWTAREHLTNLVRAYNCAVRDFDLTVFLEQVTTLDAILSGKEITSNDGD